MVVQVREAGLEALAAYGRISIAFEVRSVLKVEAIEGGMGGFSMREEPVNPPYLKDYDALDEGGPERWPEQFDTSHFTLLLAEVDGELVGSATMVYDTPDLTVLEGLSDLAVVWDIRVHPRWRGKGVGEALFEHAKNWAAAHGCTMLKVETQNVNVSACLFYRRMGCELGAIHRFGYLGNPQIGEEVMLLWYLRLVDETDGLIDK